MKTLNKKVVIGLALIFVLCLVLGWNQKVNDFEAGFNFKIAATATFFFLLVELCKPIYKAISKKKSVR